MRNSLSKVLICSLSATALLSGTALAGPHAPELLPPSSNPGECWARVMVPAEFRTGEEIVQTSDAYSTLSVRQPQFAARQENIMTKEPGVRYEVRQPRYRSITEQIVTRPAYDKLSVTPPRFSTVDETVQTSAPRLIWKKGNPGALRQQGYTIHSTADGGRHGQGYSSTTEYGAFQAAGLGGQECGDACEIWCLVEEPGSSVRYKRKVMTSPGEVTRVRMPEIRKTITKQVLADPGGVREIPIPAEYATVTIEDMVDAGGAMETAVGPQYGRIDTQELVSGERYEWRRVLCKPGTGSIGGGYTQTSGAGYSQGHNTTYSTGYPTQDHHAQSYSAPVTQHSYSGMGYGSDHGVHSSGTTLKTKTGYYGADNHPAYQEQSYHGYESGRYGAKRKRRRH